MNQWRVHYTHRGVPASTVLVGETPQAARTSFQHHYGRNVPIERIEPVGARAVSAPEKPTAPRGEIPRRASEGEMRQVANALRGLRGHLASLPRAGHVDTPACPECGGPAERVWGRRSGHWFVRTLGCGHPNVHPSTAEAAERRARALEVLAATKPGIPPQGAAPEPVEQAA